MANLDFKKSRYENKRQKSDFLLTISASAFQIEMSPVMLVVEEKTMLIQIFRALVL